MDKRKRQSPDGRESPTLPEETEAESVPTSVGYDSHLEDSESKNWMCEYSA